MDPKKVPFTDPGPRKQTDRRTTAALQLAGVLDRLNSAGILNVGSDNTEQEQDRAISALASKIITLAYAPRELRREVEYALKIVHAINRDVGDYIFTEADDDDDDEVSTAPLNITAQRRQQAVQDLDRTSKLLFVLYYSLLLDDYIYRARSNNLDPLKQAQVTEVVERLKEISDKVNPALYAQLYKDIQARLKSPEPGRNAAVSNIGAGVAAAAPRKTGSTTNTTSESQAVSVMRSFLMKHDIADQSATPASSYRFAIKLLNDEIDSAVVGPALKSLMSDATISALVNRETLDTIKHPDNVVNEAKFIDEIIVQSITLIYWTLTFKRYLEAGYNSSNPQYVKVRDTLIELGTNLIKDRGTRVKFDSAVTRLDREANSAGNQSSAAATQRRAAQRGEPAPAQQPAPAAKVPSAQAQHEAEKLFSAVYQQRGGSLYKTLQRVQADERGEAIEDAKSMFIDGVSVPEIVNLLQSTYGLTESSILSGITLAESFQSR
jgi:hypothetical protein